MRSLAHITSGFNVQPLLAAIKRQPQLWNQRTFRADHPSSPHREVDDIWLRYNAWENMDPSNRAAFGEKHESVWYPEYRCLPQAMPLIFKLMNMVNGERLGGVFVTRIPAGKQCYPHVDKSWHVDHYDKYVIQLESSPRQVFCFEGESLVSAPGDVFWFDNRQKHWVTNDSEQDRISLICAIRSDRYEG